MNYDAPLSPCHDAILRLHLSKHHPKMLNIFWNPNGFVCIHLNWGAYPTSQEPIVEFELQIFEISLPNGDIF